MTRERLWLFSGTTQKYSSVHNNYLYPLGTECQDRDSGGISETIDRTENVFKVPQKSTVYNKIIREIWKEISTVVMVEIEQNHGHRWEKFDFFFCKQQEKWIQTKMYSKYLRSEEILFFNGIVLKREKQVKRRWRWWSRNYQFTGGRKGKIRLGDSSFVSFSNFLDVKLLLK